MDSKIDLPREKHDIALRKNDIEVVQLEYHSDHALAEFTDAARVESAVPAYCDFPGRLPSYNPLTEWGSHYARILTHDYFPKVSNFDMVEVRENEITERRVSGSDAVQELLQDDPDFRMIYCDSKLCKDGVTRGSLAVDDIKAILKKYDMSILFLDYFIGRNRTTMSSRKAYSQDNPTEVVSYEIWYILPSRIYDEDEYDCHFILFTIYLRYDCRTKKTFMFCIHRLGGDQESASRCSAQIKHRMLDALQQTWNSPSFTQLRGNPFVLQLPTITSSVVLWIESLHTERLSMWAREEELEDLFKIDTAALHNVSRYIHSYKTNIFFTIKVLEFIRKEHAWFANNLGNSENYGVHCPAYRTIEDSLDSQINQMDIVSTYADEVVKRTEILIAIYFNRMSETDSRAMSGIAVETRRDAVSMRTIAIVTLIFLPATFISMFFSMTFFQDGGPLALSKIWLYPATVIPTTILVLACWALWHRQYQKRTQKLIDAEAGDFQKRRLSTR